MFRCDASTASARSKPNTILVTTDVLKTFLIFTHLKRSLKWKIKLNEHFKKNIHFITNSTYKNISNEWTKRIIICKEKHNEKMENENPYNTLPALSPLIPNSTTPPFPYLPHSSYSSFSNSPYPPYSYNSYNSSYNSYSPPPSSSSPPSHPPSECECVKINKMDDKPDNIPEWFHWNPHPMETHTKNDSFGDLKTSLYEPPTRHLFIGWVKMRGKCDWSDYVVFCQETAKSKENTNSNLFFPLYFF